MTRSNIVQGDKSRLHLIEALGVIKHVHSPSLIIMTLQWQGLCGLCTNVSIDIEYFFMMEITHQVFL